MMEGNEMRSKKKLLTGILAGALIFASSQAAFAYTKNVILMISDGQGFNTVKATDYYVGSQAVYEGLDFVKYGMQTNSANNPAGYNPVSMANSFGYSMTGATDSASAATAMYTGVKNYDGTVNLTTDSKPLTTYFEKAAQAGKSIGAVSSVEFSHATPAAVYGHNSSRNNYAAIGYEGVYGSNPLNNLPNSGSNPQAGNNALYDSLNYNNNLKVLMGAGHGDYTDSGVYDLTKTDNFAGGSAAWTAIKTATPNGWTFVDTKSDFEAVANGSSNPDKLLGVAQVNTTLQQARNNPAGNFDPLNANVPTLETMTRAALNVLDNSPNGFAVMIEGGAVDWANHANQLDRMIEEQIDFNNSVQAVVNYLNANTNGNNWTNTLLIVTADHETGHLWGPGTFTDVNSNGRFDASIDTFIAYQQIANNGVGILPGAQYASGDHTNALVPLFAKGAGSELFANYVIATDSNLMEMYGLDSSWAAEKYIDNTAIFSVMMEASPVPVPGAVWLFASGLLGLAGLRKKFQG
jgi:alkaline phosphatase